MKELITVSNVKFVKSKPLLESQVNEKDISLTLEHNNLSNNEISRFVQFVIEAASLTKVKEFKAKIKKIK